MSFGMTRAMVECHVADLHRHAVKGRTTTASVDEIELRRDGAPFVGLRNRIGLTLVEVGLHLMVRARASTRPVAPPAVLLRPSSTARGR
jgi:hypothetical protein